MQKNQNNILIIGLGQIGYSNAEYMTRLGLNVDGYDIDPKAVNRALEKEVIRKKATTFRDYDYYIICVSTHNIQKMCSPSFNGLLETAHRLAYEGKPGALVAIESTITKGMSKKINKILDHRLHVAHVPHRFYGEDTEEHGVCQTRILGGCEKCCSEKALCFYQELLEIPVQAVRPIELAEISKIVENSHRFMEIAFAEELKMLCDAYCLDFKALRKAVNSKWNVKILEPKQGIGGHCLPKDSQMYVDLSKQVLVSSIVDSAKIVDEEYKTQLPQNQTICVFPQPRLSDPPRT